MFAFTILYEQLFLLIKRCLTI